MKMLKTLVASAVLAMSTGAFAATVLPGNETPLQDVINNLYTQGGTPTSAAPNVNANQSGAQLFQIEASGGSIATMVIAIAGNAGSNTFGIYDPYNTATTLQLFAGGISGGSLVTLSVNDSNQFQVGSTTVQFSSSTFGYYLTGPGGTFYSQANLNGGNEQMVSYQGDGDKIKLPTRPAAVWGPSSYLLAWEDQSLTGDSDKDYNDMVIYVESVTKVPEPGSLALLGLGLSGLAFVSRRKQKNAK